MKNIKIILLTLMLLVSTSAFSQIKIPNTNFSFTLPGTEWKYLETTKINNNTIVYLYSYSADYVIDNSGDTVLPFMRIYLRRNFKGTVYDLAYSRFMSQPFQSLDEHILDNGGLEYLGAYTNEQDGKDYELRMLYLKDQDDMVEVRLETTVDTFDQFDESFQSIISSVSK